MRILKLLIKKLIILTFLLVFYPVNSDEPVDIWNIDQSNKNKNTNSQNENEVDNDTNIQPVNQVISIEEENKILEEEKYLFGIYDPAENDFTLNMWELSNKEKILKIINKIDKINLSDDAKKFIII